MAKGMWQPAERKVDRVKLWGMLESGKTQAECARFFNVTRGAISWIVVHEKGSNRGLTPPERARIVAMREMGYTLNQIKRKTKRSDKAIRSSIEKGAENNDIKEMVKTIKENELDELTVIGDKARKTIVRLLDEGEVKPIEAVAIMDRSFQQRQLLTGGATSHIVNITKFIEQACAYENDTKTIDITPPKEDVKDAPSTQPEKQE